MALPLLYCSLFLSLSCIKLIIGSSPFVIKDSDSTVNVTFGEIKLEVTKSPWRLRVLETSTDKPILTEVSQSDHRLGFGKWEGKILDIYQGYLFRVGFISEWYSSQEVKRWSNTSNTVTFLLSTSDKAGREIIVNFTNFQIRKFQLNAAVLGNNLNDSNRMAIGFESLASSGEGFYGFGERFTQCNQRGHRVGSWLEDGSWGLGVFDPAIWKLRVPAGEESTYCPMPILYSTFGYALQMDTYYRTVYDLAKTNEDIILLEQETNTLNIIFYLSRNPREAFHMVSDNNGKSLIPPAWEFSPWNQLHDEDPSKTISQRIEDFFFKYDIPCSHSINTVHFFPGGDERGREDELKQENDKLLTLGVKSTAYFNPMIETDYSELYNYGASHHFFLKTQDGLPYNYSYIGASTFFVSQVDFTNPQAVTWYQEQLARSVALSFHGWMYDYGEYTPHDSISSNGTGGLKMHNEVSHLYQKAAFDYLTSLDSNPNDSYAPDYVFYVRSSYTGAQRYTWAQWTGDPSSDWSYASGLPAQITASLNIGLSGMPFSGSDIGGFEWYVDPVPDKELWSRWTAAGCLSGLMHEQGGGKGTGRKSHIFDFPNGTEIWRKFAKLRMQLFPYLYTQAHIAHESGLPIMRHHLLHFWNDTKAISQDQQYMFGESFLAAPVVDENVDTWEVYLPSYVTTSGPDWLDVSSNAQYDTSDGRFRIGFGGYHIGGQAVQVNAPLDTVPLFVIAGSIIPIADPRIMTLNNASNSSVITWEAMKHVRHLWVFADKYFNATGHCWDTNLYKLSHNQPSQLDWLIQGSPDGYTHIIQIAGPWNDKVVQIKVEGETLKDVEEWKELLQVNYETFYFDKTKGVLWLKLINHTSAAIVLNAML